jgi:hypothetical protein
MQHIVAAPDYCANQVSFPGVSHNQLLLSHLDEKIFPATKYANGPKKDISCMPCFPTSRTHYSIDNDIAIPNLPAKVMAMTSNLLSTIRPLAPPTPEELVAARDKFTPLTSSAAPLELSHALKKAIAIAKRNLKQVVERGQAQQIEGADVGVVALGTGGSMPSTHRNGSHPNHHSPDRASRANIHLQYCQPLSKSLATATSSSTRVKERGGNLLAPSGWKKAQTVLGRFSETSSVSSSVTYTEITTSVLPRSSRNVDR